MPRAGRCRISSATQKSGRLSQLSTSSTELEILTTSIIETDEIDNVDYPWIVIVWNDPINLMTYVTFVFQKLFGFSTEKATKLMLDVHEKGRAVVSSGTKDRAEIDVNRLHQHGLWATMEQNK